MSLRNITGGQVFIGVSLIFLSIVMIVGINQASRLADNIEEIAPAANSIGTFLTPHATGSDSPREVPVSNVQRTKKIQDMTTIEVDDMKPLTEDQLVEIERLKSLNYTTQAIWNSKNNVLLPLEKDLIDHMELIRKQQDAIDNPIEDQNPDSLRLGLATLHRGLETRRGSVVSVRNELSGLQRTLDERTHLISEIVGQK